jgi:hypothetical protein
VQGLSSGVQHTAGAAQEIEATAQDLERRAEELQAAIAFFQLGAGRSPEALSPPRVRSAA